MSRKMIFPVENDSDFNHFLETVFRLQIVDVQPFPFSSQLLYLTYSRALVSNRLHHAVNIFDSEVKCRSVLVTETLIRQAIPPQRA